VWERRTAVVVAALAEVASDVEPCRFAELATAHSSCPVEEEACVVVSRGIVLPLHCVSLGLVKPLVRTQDGHTAGHTVTDGQEAENDGMESGAELATEREVVEDLGVRVEKGHVQDLAND